jgi:hypothetical protein
MTLIVPFVFCAKPVLYVWATEALAENKVMGLSSMSAFGVLGQTFGPILMGFSFDTYKSYSVGLLVLGLCEFAVVAALVALQVELVGMVETFRSIRRLVLTCNCSEPPDAEGASDGVELGTIFSDELAIPYESMSHIEIVRQQ